MEPNKPEVFISGTKIPYLTDWLYTVTVDGTVKDKINSRRRWTAQEIIDVTGYYTESLTGYVFGGEHLEGRTPPVNPTIRKPVFKKYRRTARAVED